MQDLSQLQNTQSILNPTEVTETLLMEAELWPTEHDWETTVSHLLKHIGSTDCPEKNVIKYVNWLIDTPAAASVCIKQLLHMGLTPLLKDLSKTNLNCVPVVFDLLFKLLKEPIASKLREDGIICIFIMRDIVGLMEFMTTLRHQLQGQEYLSQLISEQLQHLFSYFLPYEKEQRVLAQQPQSVQTPLQCLISSKQTALTFIDTLFQKFINDFDYLYKNNKHHRIYCVDYCNNLAHFLLRKDKNGNNFLLISALGDDKNTKIKLILKFMQTIANQLDPKTKPVPQKQNFEQSSNLSCNSLIIQEMLENIPKEWETGKQFAESKLAAAKNLRELIVTWKQKLLSQNSQHLAQDKSINQTDILVIDENKRKKNQPNKLASKKLKSMTFLSSSLNALKEVDLNIHHCSSPSSELPSPPELSNTKKILPN